MNRHARRVAALALTLLLAGCGLMGGGSADSGPGAEVKLDVAKLMNLPSFGSILDARRIQRVPDLLEQLGVITTTMDAASVIVPQVVD